MRPEFLKDTDNVSRFLAGVQRVKQSGASEACWHLVEGDPGYGKSRTLLWWSVREQDVLLRAKSGWTLHWALKELVTALGYQPTGRTDALFQTALGALAGSKRGIHVDEIDHTLRDTRVLEMLRDISDLTGTHITVAGHTGVGNSLRRHAQVYSRISNVTVFGPCDVHDVRKICDGLAEASKGQKLHLKDDLVGEIHRRTGGRLRDVKKALANVERVASKLGLAEIGLHEVPVEVLTSDGKIGGRK